MEEAKPFVETFIKSLLAKKSWEAEDTSVFLLYDVSKQIGGIRQQLNELSHTIEKLGDQLAPLAGLAKETLEERRKSK